MAYKHNKYTHTYKENIQIYSNSMQNINVKSSTYRITNIKSYKLNVNRIHTNQISGKLSILRALNTNTNIQTHADKLSSALSLSVPSPPPPRSVCRRIVSCFSLLIPPKSSHTKCIPIDCTFVSSSNDYLQIYIIMFKTTPSTDIYTLVYTPTIFVVFEFRHSFKHREILEHIKHHHTTKHTHIIHERKINYFFSIQNANVAWQNNYTFIPSTPHHCPPVFVRCSLHKAVCSCVCCLCAVDNVF